MPCHNHPGAWEIIPGTQEVLGLYDWSKVGFGICSNQAGIALGYIEEKVVLAEIYQTMRDIFAKDYMPHRFPTRGNTARIRYSPYAPDASSPWRKPSPLMLLDLIAAYEERVDKTLFVGDSPEDAAAAARAGCHFLPAWQFFNRAEVPANTVKAHEVKEREG